MKEKASRYAASAGSEEIELMPEPKESSENRSDDDDAYSPPRPRRQSGEREKGQTPLSDTSYQRHADENPTLINGRSTGKIKHL